MPDPCDGNAIEITDIYQNIAKTYDYDDSP
jgi:hypothetical protein